VSRVCSRLRLLVVVKKTAQVGTARFCTAPPCTPRCKAPAPRWVSIASQFRLGLRWVNRWPGSSRWTPPYHQGARGHVMGRVPHLRGATRHAIASRAVDNGSGMYVAAQGQPRVSLARTRRHRRRSQVRRTDRWGGNSPRLARHGSAWSRVQVRVTTANGCFMAQRPTDAASGLLGLDGLAAGTQGSTQSWHANGHGRQGPETPVAGALGRNRRPWTGV